MYSETTYTKYPFGLLDSINEFKRLYDVFRGHIRQVSFWIAGCTNVPMYSGDIPNILLECRTLPMYSEAGHAKYIFELLAVPMNVPMYSEAEHTKYPFGLLGVPMYQRPFQISFWN